MTDRGKLHLTLSSQYPPVSSSPRPSDNLTLPYPYYLHFPHEIHTFNQDMGKFTCFFICRHPSTARPVPRPVSPADSAELPRLQSQVQNEPDPHQPQQQARSTGEREPQETAGTEHKVAQQDCNSNPVLLLSGCCPLNTATQKTEDVK